MNELEEEIISIMNSIDGSSKDEFASVTLTDLSDIFWEELENTNKNKYKERFQEYIESNFTKVYDIEQSKRHLLNSDWETIFTLNYDDTIETVLDIDVVIPYDKFSVRSGRNRLIKLHGDAKKFAVTGNQKFCVLGNRQYVELVKDADNKDIVNALENTFFSKSILFVGCSLINELDLLYSAGVHLEQKVKSNGEHHIIYLLYSDKTQEINPIPYKKYGITDIIKVNKETIIDFYELVYKINKRRLILRESDSFKEYTNIEFEYLDERNEENLDYLFYNDKVSIRNQIIKLPAYFIERNCIKKVQKEIKLGKGVLNIIYGTKFSGKTYALLQLLRNLQDKRVYYFPSYITLGDETIANLLERENSVFLIDDGAISFEQYTDIIVPQLNRFEEAKIKIVLTVNKGDVEFYKFYKNLKNINEDRIKLYGLDNKLDPTEAKLFNEKIGKISLKPYKKTDTLLDFLFRIDASVLRKKQKVFLPRVNFLSNDYEKEVRTLIILATKKNVTSKIAIDLGIDDILYDFTNRFSMTVQKDYLSDIEKKTDVYSGFKFILNSSYWALKSLSHFASNLHNHKTIVKAYSNIVSAYSGLERREMNNRIKVYYMLDRIQWLFSDQESKGTIRLPYLIYEGIHSSLNWNYQFLHQEAKCELRMARRENGIEDKRKILELAYRNIGRALELAEEIAAGKVEYTIAHMNVTKALILINYIFTGEKEQFKNTVEACYEAFVIGESLCPQLEKEEMKDVKKFLESNWDEKIEKSNDLEDKLNALYTKYVGRPSWANNNI